MIFTDRAAVSGTHRTGDGYLATQARISRTGIQIYSGAEVGREDLTTVRVYRSPEEVFAPAAMSSAAHKPMTVDHPADSVTSRSWRDKAVGWTGEAVTRDGDTIRVPMMIADADAIAAIESGKRELSCGYTCQLDWTPGTTPAGEAYDARQVGIRLNHVAIVAAGRAGAQCRIGDAAGASFLRDASGNPLPLYDIDTGAAVAVNENLIAAIVAEAAKAGLNLREYLKAVLRYRVAAETLSGNHLEEA